MPYLNGKNYQRALMQDGLIVSILGSSFVAQAMTLFSLCSHMLIAMVVLMVESLFLSMKLNCLGGDQGLLNAFFSDWSKGDGSKRIPFGYNLTINASYSYLPAFKHFQNEVKVVHFIGYNKPWTFHRFADGNVIPHGQQSQDYLKFVQMWWWHYDDLKNKLSDHASTSNIPSNNFQASHFVRNVIHSF